MKNLVSKFLVIALVASVLAQPAHALMGPIRAAKCIFDPKKNSCSKKEIKEARGWLIGASAATLAALVAGVSIAFGVSRSQANAAVDQEQAKYKKEDWGRTAAQAGELQEAFRDLETPEQRLKRATEAFPSAAEERLKGY